MKKLWEKLLLTGIWLCASVVLLLVLLLLASLLTLFLLQGGRTEADGWMAGLRAIPSMLRLQAFSVSTAIAGVALALPFALALCLAVVALLPKRLASRLHQAVWCYSAIPAVVFGYMGLRYIAPAVQAPWPALTLTLALMAVPRLCVDFVQAGSGSKALEEAAASLGARVYESVFRFIVPALWREAACVTLRAIARSLCEGVAVLTVMTYFGREQDTLTTAIMRAAGVAGIDRPLYWVLTLTWGLIVPLLLLLAIIAALQRGRSHAG